MKIRVVKRISKKLNDFSKKEWRKVDFIHYGKPTDWKQETFIFIALEKGEIIGFSETKLEAGVMFVRQLLVGEGNRGKGVGKLLMLKVENEAKKQKAHKVFLNTDKGWDSEKFYESLGYSKTADLPTHFFKRDFVEYSKYLK